MFQSLEQCRAYLFASVYGNLPVYLDLQWELVLFLSDTGSVAVTYMAVPKLGIELSKFYLCQFQEYLISCHNIDVVSL